MTYANVVATLALFLAVGGGAYAVSKIGSKQIARNAAKGRDVAEATLGTVPNAARLGGRSLGEIVEWIDFSAFGASQAEHAEETQRIGRVDVTVRCTMAGGIGSDAILQIDGERQVDAAVLFDTTLARTNNTLGHRAGGFEPDGILFMEQGTSSRGNFWIVWREPSRTVSIQGRYDVFRDIQADCDVNAVATIAPA